MAHVRCRLAAAARPSSCSAGAQLLAASFLLAFALLPAEGADAQRGFNWFDDRRGRGRRPVIHRRSPRALGMWLWDLSLGTSSVILGFVIT